MSSQDTEIKIHSDTAKESAKTAKADADRMNYAKRKAAERLAFFLQDVVSARNRLYELENNSVEKKELVMAKISYGTARKRKNDAVHALKTAINAHEEAERKADVAFRTAVAVVKETLMSGPYASELYQDAIMVLNESMDFDSETKRDASVLEGKLQEMVNEGIEYSAIEDVKKSLAFHKKLHAYTTRIAGHLFHLKSCKIHYKLRFELYGEIIPDDQTDTTITNNESSVFIWDNKLYTMNQVLAQALLEP